MRFKVGDILDSGEFSNPNLTCLIIKKEWDNEEDCWIYTVQHFINSGINCILHDTVVALAYEG